MLGKELAVLFFGSSGCLLFFGGILLLPGGLHLCLGILFCSGRKNSCKALLADAADAASLEEELIASFLHHGNHFHLLLHCGIIDDGLCKALGANRVQKGLDGVRFVVTDRRVLVGKPLGQDHVEANDCAHRLHNRVLFVVRGISLCVKQRRCIDDEIPQLPKTILLRTVGQIEIFVGIALLLLAANGAELFDALHTGAELLQIAFLMGLHLLLESLLFLCGLALSFPHLLFGLALSLLLLLFGLAPSLLLPLFGFDGLLPLRFHCSLVECHLRLFHPGKLPNGLDGIDPADYAQWAMPRSLKIKSRTIEINDIITHNMRIVKFPGMVDDAWLASVMSFPSTRVMIKCKPMDKAKSIRKIDWALQELRVQHENTSIDSKMLELQTQIESLSQLLVTLQGDNEALFNCNVYITTFDIETTNLWRGEKNPLPSERYYISGIKKQVRRMYQEHEFRVNDMDFRQMDAFIGAQVSAYDPLWKDAYGLPSNSVAASYPWVFANLADEGGMKLGASGHVPVFINFFRRDRERINSNMVIIGKSGSGKSYATKSLLTNLATEDAKIFILDPENEYTELASNLHGKFINVGNAQFGRLNPFHIITALDDDEAGATVSGSYATHLQFLEEFFRQILPECEKDALEYLNSLVDRMYFNFGITAETDLSLLSPEDYPIFDDLYDIVLEEFQKTDNAFIRTMLRTLMNYIAKFSTGGRNANIWNGPSTITTEENFTVFNFQSLLANRNQTIANAQMLLVLKYVDNEIIKNRDYNTKYNANRKIVVVIDEAHVFIDDKFPIALDFMYQLAKRIRKYNGMQIVITQNIKDFVGSEELVKKSTAIINACQYSLIFSLAPNDMDDLCKLYEKAGGINQTEQEEIVSAPRGQAFAVMSPTSRSTFQVEVPQSVVELFQEKEYQTHYFAGAEGAQVWEDFLGDSREKYDESTKWKQSTREKRDEASRTPFRFSTLGDNEEPFPVKSETPKPIPVLEEEAEEAEDLDDRIDQIQTENAPVPPRRFVAPETVRPIEPAPVMQPTQVNVDLSTTNSLLRSVLEQFTGDSIRMQVERMVKQQLEQSVQPILERMQQAPVAPPAPAQPQPAAEEEPQTGFPVETEEEEPLFDFGNIFEEESDNSDMEEPADPVGFDLRAMLCQEAEKLEGMGAIELMFYYEEDTAQIKLEDLAQYTRSLRRKR